MYITEPLMILIFTYQVLNQSSDLSKPDYCRKLSGLTAYYFCTYVVLPNENSEQLS